MTKIILYLRLVSAKILAQETKGLSAKIPAQETKEQRKKRQDAIVQEHIYDCADKINFYYKMQEYQACIDAGIK